MSRKYELLRIDSLILSLGAEIRRAAKEPIKAFLTVTKQKEEQCVTTHSDDYNRTC